MNDKGIEYPGKPAPRAIQSPFDRILNAHDLLLH